MERLLVTDTCAEAAVRLRIPRSVYAAQEGILWGVTRREAIGPAFQQGCDLQSAWRLPLGAQLKELEHLAPTGDVLVPIPAARVNILVPVMVASRDASAMRTTAPFGIPAVQGLGSMAQVLADMATSLLQTGGRECQVLLLQRPGVASSWQCFDAGRMENGVYHDTGTSDVMAVQPHQVGFVVRTDARGQHVVEDPQYYVVLRLTTGDYDNEVVQMLEGLQVYYRSARTSR